VRRGDLLAGVDRDEDGGKPALRPGTQEGRVPLHEFSDLRDIAAFHGVDELRRCVRHVLPQGGPGWRWAGFILATPAHGRGPVRGPPGDAAGAPPRARAPS